MTYNFDPDRWYERERLRLELEHQSDRLSDADLVVGFILLMTAVFGRCPAYMPFGINTCKTK